MTITFKLPKCSSAAGLNLEVTERVVTIDHREQNYHVEVPLSYPVLEVGLVEEEGSEERLL